MTDQSSLDPWSSQWKLKDKLGEGGQGETWRVVSKTDENQRGVLKRLKDSTSPAARARLIREVSTLKQLGILECPNVPRVLDDNISDEPKGVVLYFVMDEIQGKTLKDAITENSRMALKDAIQVVLRLCETMKIAHANGIVHRDIKPANIMLDAKLDNRVWLIDFGLSFKEADADITETNEPIRNSLITLPEFNTSGSDNRNAVSDVTTLSAIFYYLLTGRTVGLLQDDQGKAVHRRKTGLLDTIINNSIVRQRINHVLDIGFTLSMQNRFQSIGDFVANMEALQKTIDNPTYSSIQEAADYYGDIVNNSYAPAMVHRASRYVDDLWSNVIQWCVKHRDMNFCQLSAGQGMNDYGHAIQAGPLNVYSNRLVLLIHVNGTEIYMQRVYSAVVRQQSIEFHVGESLVDGSETIYKSAASPLIMGMNNDSTTFDKIIDELQIWLVGSFSSISDYVLSREIQ